MAEKYDSGIRPLYAVVIHECICTGDVNKMKQCAKEAETYLQQTGDVSAALQALKIEIAKAEHKK
jgi:Domain of unknown function (DUF1843)